MAEKKLVFSVSAVGDEATIKKLAELRLIYKQLSQDIAAANKAGDLATFQNLSVAQEKVKVKIAETSKELKDQKKQFETSKYPTDSLRSLEQQYGKLATSIRNMSAAQRESSGGQASIALAKQLKDQVNKTSQAFGDTSKNIGNYANSITEALKSPLDFIKGAGLIGAIVSVGSAAISASEKFIKAYDDSAKAATKLLVAMDGNKEAAKRLEEQANKLSLVTLFQDEDIENAQALLATLGFTEKQISKLTPVVVDYASATGKDLTSAVNTVGKSINGTSTETDKLSIKYGNAKTQAQRTKAAVDDLTGAFGGQAVEAAKVGSGPIELLKKQWGELQEEIGGSLLRLVSSIIPALNDGTDIVVGNLGKLLAAIHGFVAGANVIGNTQKNVFGLLANSATSIYYQVTKLFGNKEAQIKIDELSIDTDKILGNLKKDLVNPFAVAKEAYKKELDDLKKSIIDGLNVPVKPKGKTDKGLTPAEITALEKAAKFQIDLNNKIAQSKVDAIQNPINRIIAQKELDLKKLTEIRNQIIKDGLAAGVKVDAKAVDELISNQSIVIEKKFIEEFQSLQEKAKQAIADLIDNIGFGDTLQDKVAHEIAKGLDLPDSLFKAAKKVGIKISKFLFGGEGAENEKEKLDDLINKDEIDKKEKFSKLLENQQKVFDQYDKKRRKELEDQSKRNKKTGSLLDQLFGVKGDGSIEDEKKKALQDGATSTLNAIADIAIIALDREAKAVEKNKNLRLNALNSEYDKKKAFAAGNNELLTKLEGERLQKEEAINKEAAKKKQQIAVKQALINAALAATNVLANTIIPFPASLLLLIPLAASLATQIAAIKSQGFAKGGFTGRGNERDHTGKKVAGIVHEKEYVSPESQVVRYPNLLHWMDEERKQPGLKPPKQFAALAGDMSQTNSTMNKNIPTYNEYSQTRLRPFASGGFTSPQSSIPTVMVSLSPDRFNRYTTGGFTTPVIRLTIPTNQSNNNQQTTATFTDEQVSFIANEMRMAVKDGAKVGSELGGQKLRRNVELQNILRTKLTT